jgi:Spy/CpxP family protein refolding chaperone
MRRLLAMLVLATLSAAAAGAQRPANGSSTDRAALEQQFRQRAAVLTQQKLGLTDTQLTQLEQTNARYEPQLNKLVSQERETRRQLRLEMSSGNKANQQHVSNLIDTSISLQKQRIAIVEAEQKDLARFMSPTQRAGYLALQAQVRRRAQELTRGGGPGARARLR